MKSEKKEKIARFVISFFCFTAYISFISAVLANAVDTDLYHFLLG